MSLLSPGGENLAKPARLTRWVFVFGVAIALLGTVGWLNWHQIDRMQETENWVNHSERVHDAFDLLLLQLHHVQGNERGYVVTGEPVYLKAFQAAIVDSETQFKTVQTLIADNSVQRSHSAKLQGLVAKVFLIAGKQVV